MMTDWVILDHFDINPRTATRLPLLKFGIRRSMAFFRKFTSGRVARLFELALVYFIDVTILVARIVVKRRQYAASVFAIH